MYPFFPQTNTYVITYQNIFVGKYLNILIIYKPMLFAPQIIYRPFIGSSAYQFISSVSRKWNNFGGNTSCVGSFRNVNISQEVHWSSNNKWVNICHYLAVKEMEISCREGRGNKVQNILRVMWDAIIILRTSYI